MVRNSKGQFEPKHGLCDSRIYHIWEGMKARCNRVSCNGYEKYGGSGIGYDEGWDIFENFYEDMIDGYRDDLSLDRIDNTRNYSRDNCRWVTTRQQQCNKTNNIKVTIKGITMCLSEWRDLFNLTNSIIYKRFKRGEHSWHLIRPSNCKIHANSTYGRENHPIFSDKEVK